MNDLLELDDTTRKWLYSLDVRMSTVQFTKEKPCKRSYNLLSVNTDPGHLISDELFSHSTNINLELNCDKNSKIILLQDAASLDR